MNTRLRSELRRGKWMNADLRRGNSAAKGRKERTKKTANTALSVVRGQWRLWIGAAGLIATFSKCHNSRTDPFILGPTLSGPTLSLIRHRADNQGRGQIPRQRLPFPPYAFVTAFAFAELFMRYRAQRNDSKSRLVILLEQKLVLKSK